MIACLAGQPVFWSVAAAYRARRQLGELDHLAAMAALEAFRATMPDVPEVEARATVRLIIARAARERRSKSELFRSIPGLAQELL